MILPLLPNVGSSDDHGLDQALRRAAGLIASAAGVAFALEELGAIDLPPSLGPSLDQAQLRAIASLYLASELESAGVVTAVETLSGLGRSGGLGVDVGAAAPLLAHFWKTRNDRATAQERAACFARIFGLGSEGGGGFDEAMLELCEALYKLDEGATNASYGGIAQQMRVRSAAERLVEQLVTASGGITVFLAQEVLQGLREALAILGHPALRGAFGARDVWVVIGAIDRLARTKHGDGRLYFRRGKAGMTVLAWLADAAVHLTDTGGVLVGLDHPVISAAIEWIQAALAIGETGTTAIRAAPDVPAATPTVPGLPVSPWATIAG
jgi:hypothetical protein